MLIDIIRDGTPAQLWNPEDNALPQSFPLPDSMNPFKQDGIQIYAVTAYTPQMPTIKAGMVRHMLNTAYAAGQLEGVHTLVAATSGGTGASLAVYATHFAEIQKVICVVENDLADGKFLQLRFLGASMVESASGLDTIKTARMMGGQKGYYCFDQYNNPCNWQYHQRHTGPHVWRQTEQKVSLVSIPMGTKGTAIGVSRFLKAAVKEAHPMFVLGAICADNEPIPGMRTRTKLASVDFDEKPWVDVTVEVDRKNAYRNSLRLCRLGHLAGPSSGGALAALIYYLGGLKSMGQLDNLRVDGRITAAFLCSDTALHYLDKYSTILDGRDFNFVSMW